MKIFTVSKFYKKVKIRKKIKFQIWKKKIKLKTKNLKSKISKKKNSNCKNFVDAKILKNFRKFISLEKFTKIKNS